MANNLNPTSSHLRAFPSHADPSRYFPAKTSESARKRLTLGLTRGEGISLLIASPGCGKSMLLETLAKELEPTLRVVRLASTHICTRRALLQAILFGLNESYENRDEGELRLSLVRLIEDHLPPIVLLVDEAQSLPVRLLEELRMLANISVSGEPKFRLLLAGCPSLDEALTSPELSAFNQRITTRSYLAPLNHEETTQYVRSHISAAGGDPDQLFDPDAFIAIHQASDGLPRLINQVCDRALLLAVEQESEYITSAAIQAAWSDLHQLPAPWHTPSQTALAASIGLAETDEQESNLIEFGSLDEDLGAFENVVDAIPSQEPQEQELLDTEPTNMVQGDWNADQALQGLTLQEENTPDTSDDYKLAEDIPEETTEQEDEELVSLAFPWAQKTTEETETPAVPEPAAEEIIETEDLETEELCYHDDLTELDPVETIQNSVIDVPLAADPFSETFEEEELVVLDRCRGVEAIIRHDAQTVTNLEDLSFGLMFQALEPAVENLIDDIRSQIDGPVIGGGLSLVADSSLLVDEDPFADLPLVTVANAPEAASFIDDFENDFVEEYDALPFDDSDLLIIEPDEEPVKNSGVVRRDYSQLFAGLRQN